MPYSKVQYSTTIFNWRGVECGHNSLKKDFCSTRTPVDSIRVMFPRSSEIFSDRISSSGNDKATQDTANSRQVGFLRLLSKSVSMLQNQSFQRQSTRVGAGALNVLTSTGRSIRQTKQFFQYILVAQNFLSHPTSSWANQVATMLM